MTAPHLRERSRDPAPERETRHPTPAGQTPSPEWDERLRAARSGDEPALREIYRDTQPRLLRYLRTLVGGEAEDVASEAWLRIARDLPGFTGDYAGFRAWAATIARHRAIDHLRRRDSRPVGVAPLDGPAYDLPGPDDTAFQAIDSAATRRAVAMLAELPRDQAEAVLLRAVMGLDAPTAGRILGKRPGAVRTAAHRGLRRLAALIGQQRGPDAGPGVTPAERSAVEEAR